MPASPALVWPAGRSEAPGGPGERAGGGAGAALRPAVPQCWENVVGQELYRLMVLDFLFTLLDTLFGELVWR